MALKATVGDIVTKKDALIPTAIFPIAIRITGRDNPHTSAILITMHTWTDFFTTSALVSQSIKFGTFSLDNPLDFEFEIPIEKIRKLEIRKSDDIGFEFRISVLHTHDEYKQMGQGVSVGIKATGYDSDTARKRIPASDWLNFLNDCGYTDSAFFAIHNDIAEELDNFRKSVDPKLSFNDAIREALRRAKQNQKA